MRDGWGGDQFAIKLRKRGVKIPGPGFHLAFAAPSRRAVDVFYQAALKHGGKANGAAGLPLEYGPHDYAAFVFDPDGCRIDGHQLHLWQAGESFGGSDPIKAAFTP